MLLGPRLERVCDIVMCTRRTRSLSFISPLANIRICTFISTLACLLLHPTTSDIMVFGLFTRKSTLDTSPSPENNQNTRLPTPTPSVASAAHHLPFRFPAVLRSTLGGSTTGLTLKDSDLATDSIADGRNNDFPAPPPPITPSPPPTASPSETKVLHDLMLTIPPKILHAYTLAHLRPQPLPSTTIPSPALGSHADNIPPPPSPNTVSKVAAFFSTLAPPPLLHCMRCHKDFYEIENDEKDKACRVPHDDESTLVSRISGGGYETLWGCCGQTAPGDGSEGPPDGWCYEGRHTVRLSLPLCNFTVSDMFDFHQTDTKRARFRADSTMHDDKLTSCLKVNCHGIRDQLPHRDSRASPHCNVATTSARKSNPSPARSHASVLITRSARKRPRKSLKGASGSENEADAESLASKAKAKERTGGSAGEKGDGTHVMAGDPTSPPKSKVKAKSQLGSRSRPPASTSTTASLPISGSNSIPVGSTKARLMAAKSTSRTLLSQSYTHLASDSEASTRPRPRTRSHVREESRGRTASKLTRADLSERAGRARKATKARSRSPTSEEEPVAEASDQEERGRDRKKRRVGRA